jgi:hypothetical protein
MAKLLEFKRGAARISEYETGVREPDLLVLLAYSQIAGIHLNLIVNDRIDLAQFRDALVQLKRKPARSAR